MITQEVPGEVPAQLRYKYLEIIGNGTFGIVCKAQLIDLGEVVAIKTVYQDIGHQVQQVKLIPRFDCSFFCKTE